MFEDIVSRGEASQMRPFENEIYLEDVLEERIRQGKKLFGRSLKLLQRQHVNRSGRIDLYTQDTTTQELVVIELKRNELDEKTVSQAAKYLNHLREDENKNVAGILCGFYAPAARKVEAEKVPGLTIYEYRSDNILD